MKLKYLKDHGRLGKKGSTLEVRHPDQAQYFIDNGIAEKATDDDQEPSEASPETMTTTNTVEPAKKPGKPKA